MGLNLDSLISTGLVEHQRRVTRYDIKWGRPSNSLYYKRLVLSYIPAYYWKLEGATSANIGFLRPSFDLSAQGSGLTYATGTVDPLDKYTALGGSGYLKPSSARTDKEALKGLTMCGWFNAAVADVTSDKIVVSKGSYRTASTATMTLGIYADGGKIYPFAQFKSGTKLLVADDSYYAIDSDWNMIACTVEKIEGEWTAYLYLNDQVVATDTGSEYAPNTSSPDPIVVGGAYSSAGVLENDARFVGKLDEVFVTFRAINTRAVQNLYVCGYRSSYIEPDEDFDTDVIGSESTPTTLDKVVAKLNPFHYWKMDSTRNTGSDWFLDDAVTTSPSHFKASGNAASATTSPPLISFKNGNTYSKKLGGGNSRARTQDNLNWGVDPGTTIDFSIVFWYKPTGFNGDYFANIMSNEGSDYLHQEIGFGVRAADKGLRFSFTRKKVVNDRNITTEWVDMGSFQMTSGVGYQIACTLSRSGYVTIYVNGQKVNGKQFSNIKGLTTPESTGRYIIGTDAQTKAPAFYLDELMLFQRILTQAELLLLYNIGAFGPTYATTVFGGDPQAEGAPYILNSNLYTELSNPTDISANVQDYQIETDLKQVVGTAFMTVYEKWGLQNLRNNLRANTYVVIEERYTNSDSGEDTGWVPMGHFLVDGMLGESVTADGERVYQVSLKSPLKMLGFDLAHQRVEADKLLLTKRKFDLVTTFPDYVMYQFKHNTLPGRVYDTWAEYPYPKLWATDFQNLDGANEGGISGVGDVIRIKGSNGSVAVRGGEGSVIINKNYLADSIPDNGLSDPQTLYGEVYRYATVADVERDVPISAIFFSERWYVRFSSTLNFDLEGKTLWVKSGLAKGKYYKIQQFGYGLYHLVDVNGLSISPLDEGLAVGDLLQIGDYNSVEDALRKVLLKNGYQELDEKLPFYFELDPCPNELSPSVPPLRYTIRDGNTWLEVTEEILQKYSPPDYRLYVRPDGRIKGELVGLSAQAQPVHNLVGTLDINADRTDYGIATRLIVEGSGGQSVNIALAKQYGGSAAVRAYQLTKYADDYKDLNGHSLSQMDADALVSKAFSANPKAIVPPGSGWNYGNPSRNRHYGVLFQRFGSPSQVKRWDFEDMDICAVDIGRSVNGAAYLVDAIDIGWINHFVEGNPISQSMLLYYMTEEDYEREFGKAAPSTPNDTDTSYFPPATARSWRLLVDEFALDDSKAMNELPSTEFVEQEAVRMRFLKVRVGQCQHRLKMQTGQYKDDVVSRVGLTDVRIYNSLTIQATAEIGATAPFNSGDYKELVTRVRRRSEYVGQVPFLDTYDKARDYVTTQLQERYIDFTPVTTTVFAPTVETGEVVRLVNPETNDARNYLVTACQHKSDGTVQLQLLNYDLVI